jgi:hypothetical protein
MILEDISLEMAHDDYNRALELEKNNFAAYLGRGMIYLQSG